MITNQHALEFIRKEIAHEFALLSGRVPWFASCQSFLIAAFVLSLGNPFIYKAGWLAQFVLPVLGFALALVVLPGILGAHDTIQIWLGRQHTLLRSEAAKAELAPVLNARFFEMPHADRLHNRSLWFSAALPALIGVFWAASFVLIRVVPIPHVQ